MSKKNSTSSSPDLSALAKQTMDLWQEQIANMARDPATADMMAHSMAMVARNAETFADASAKAQDMMRQTMAEQGKKAGFAHTSADSGADSGADRSGGPDSHAATSPQQQGFRSGQTADAPNGASSTASLFGTGKLDPDELLRRIADLEKRVTELESRSP